MEQYLKMVNPELRSWIIERSPASTEQAVTLAEAFISARQTEVDFRLGDRRKQHHAEPGKSGDGYGCGPRPKVFKTSTQSRWYSAGDDKTKSSSSSRPSPDNFIRCFNCNQRGHKANTCPKIGSSTSQLCYIPREGGSFKLRESTEDVTLTVKIAGKKCTALLDTGASQTLVLTDCISETQLKHTGELRVKCIHGDEQVYPTAEVHIEVNGQMYLLNVGIMRKAPYAVILGRDVPVLLDLLADKRNSAEAMVVTRAQSGAAVQENVALLKELPYGETHKGRKTKAVRRQEKVRGTPLVEKIKPVDLDSEELKLDVARQQAQDPTLKPVFLKCTEGKDEGDKQFLVKDNLLYRIKGDYEQLVVPINLRHQVLKLGHSEPWAGHMGVAKTLSRVASRFYWPRQYQDVVDFCKACPECQLTAPRKIASKVPLITLSIVDVPFSRIAMDIAGPLPTSRGGNRYILVVCDYATRYPEAFPLKKIKARQIVNCFIQLISRVGIPKEVITDQGTNFTSGLLKDVFRLLGVRGIRTTPFHPQSDGLTERFIQTL
uniref:Gypsy retrotransposon integrase-like protein 1 n=1 Tax=Astyanax mexicanus TaxID=7994 RepID=A0A8B9GZE8_ASTMX